MMQVESRHRLAIFRVACVVLFMVGPPVAAQTPGPADSKPSNSTKRTGIDGETLSPEKLEKDSLIVTSE